MSTAALQRIADVLERIEAKMPDERERAELAALTGLCADPNVQDCPAQSIAFANGFQALSKAAKQETTN